MVSIGSIAFVSPWLLLGLLLLPVLWWLLKLTPPAPQTQRFAAVRLLFGLENQEKTAASAPWWLVLIRLAAIVFLLLGLSQPLINPEKTLPGSGPILLVVDNGWASARNWSATHTHLQDIVAQAEREGRTIVMLATATSETGKPPQHSGVLRGADAKGLIEKLKPLPWAVDREGTIAALRGFKPDGSVCVIWMSNGLHDKHVSELAQTLQRLGSLRVIEPSIGQLPYKILPPSVGGSAFEVSVERVATPITSRVGIRASNRENRQIAHAELVFRPNKSFAKAVINIPVEMRNKVDRIDLIGSHGAAAVVLMDNRWQRRPVGLASVSLRDAEVSFLSDQYYIQKALEPFSEIIVGKIEQLIGLGRAVIVVPDSYPISQPEIKALEQWVKRGGMVLRFAGARLARSTKDKFVPVPLRRGGRVLGGAMRWSNPATLAQFSRKSPFFGLKPTREVTILRQVLAQPSLDLGEKTWARLSDGTPLVTADRRGEGWLVLVHTTGGMRWSTLPLSGLFVEMMRRIVSVSKGLAGDGTSDVSLAPVSSLDGFGSMVSPAPVAQSIRPDELDKASVGPTRPPGYYGAGDYRRALNLSPGLASLKRMGELPSGVAREVFRTHTVWNLKPWLLLIVFLLFVVDGVITLIMRGLLPDFRWFKRRLKGTGRSSISIVLVVSFFGFAFDVKAQDAGTNDAFVLKALRGTHLAYVTTGDPKVDLVSHAGLLGLSNVLSARTAVEPGDPIAVDVERDDLSLFPLLYWPISVAQNPLTERAIERVNRYMATGGTILFDTRDQNLGGGNTSNKQMLRVLARGLSLPPLDPVPDGHVLTKSFYLLVDFPGRWDGGLLWVERGGSAERDQVSRVITGSNNWAAAWAVDLTGRPQFAVVPGGEAQREVAFRFGVNLVMYVMTGNYKSDQVHAKHILERVGE
ncbi:MAG: hypothetical protein CMM28_02600 [Rhodospirillaceae bacterium]|nr:hypothetical protein [Rhodospirillaceae bacterium]